MGLWGAQRLGAKWKKVVMLPLFFRFLFFFWQEAPKKSMIARCQFARRRDPCKQSGDSRSSNCKS